MCDCQIPVTSWMKGWLGFISFYGLSSLKWGATGTFRASATMYWSKNEKLVNDNSLVHILQEKLYWCASKYIKMKSFSTYWLNVNTPKLPVKSKQTWKCKQQLLRKQHAIMWPAAFPFKNMALHMHISCCSTPDSTWQPAGICYCCSFRRTWSTQVLLLLKTYKSKLWHTGAIVLGSPSHEPVFFSWYNSERLFNCLHS